MRPRRKVTKLTKERAFQTIKLVAKSALDGEAAISYSELANRLSMPNDSGRGLGPILDEAAAMCVDFDLSSVSAHIVTKETLDSSQPLPSEDSFQNGYWPISGLSQADIPDEQMRIRVFEWRKVRSLNLADY